MVIFAKKIIVTYVLSFCLVYFIYGQDSIPTGSTSSQKKLTLILTKKSSSKKHTIKIGDRVKITKQNGEEMDGKIMQLHQSTIHLKKDSIALSDIYSIQRKPPLKHQITGGIIVGVGTLFLLTGTILGGMYEDGGTTNIIIGVSLAAASVPLLIQKTHNKKRWDLKIE